MITQKQLVHIFESIVDSPNCDKRKLQDLYQIGNCYRALPSLAYYEYKFEDGLFKGSRFLSTAAKVSWLNKYDNLNVLFVSGPCKGLKTKSIICFDRKVSAQGFYRTLR